MLCLALRTMVRSSEWNGLNLYVHDSKISDNWILENYFALDYVQYKNYDNAIIHLKKSVYLFPNEENLFSLAATYQSLGNIQFANKYFGESLKAKNYGLFPHHNHGLNSYLGYISTSIYLGNEFQALRTIQAALHDYPNDPSLLMYLAIEKYQQGDNHAASEAISKAYQINPDEQNTLIYNQILYGKSLEINLFDKTLSIRS